MPLASDADFNEGDHPRAENGQFGSGGGSAASGNAASSTPVSERPDTAQVNVPLSKRGDIDAQIDRYKAEQASIAVAEHKLQVAKTKTDKAAAKELFATNGAVMVAKYAPGIAKRQGLTEKQAAKAIHESLDSMVKWEPAKFLKLAEKFKAEQATAGANDCASEIEGAATMAKDHKLAMDRAAQARAPYERMAFDRGETTRRIDQDGRLYVGLSNISKANVCGYLGAEIPNGEALGLDPLKTYMLLRDPEELKKAAGTFNGLPLLDHHVPVTAERPRQDLIIGSTGTDAVYEHPYLKNTLSVWVADAIEGIESEQKRELSSAYHYLAEMTPGVYEGQRYDGVMRDIRGNHVVTCPSGRAGGDVVVGDSLPTEKSHMSKKAIPSRMSVLARGALLSVLPKLAQDHKVDFAKLVDGITTKNWAERKDGIVAALKPKLAQDVSIDDVVKMIESLTGQSKEPDVIAGDDPMEPAMDDEEEAKKKAEAEKVAKDAEEAKAKEEAEAKEKEMKDKPAMDSAAVTKLVETSVAAAVAANSTKLRAELKAEAHAARAAEAAVRPYVGELAIACDSADEVYRAAFKVLNVNVKDVHPSAFPAILAQCQKPGEQHRPAQRIAQDSKPGDDFSKLFPQSGRVKRAA